MKEINPQIISTLVENSERIQKAEKLLAMQVESMAKKVTQKKKNTILINIKGIKKIENREYFLYEYLKYFGFNASTSKEISTSLTKQSGKQFFSETHQITKDRDYLILSEKKKYEIQKDIHETDLNLIESFFKLTFRKISSKNLKINKSPNYAFLDFDKLIFPLKIRIWQSGDKFYPLGMKQQKKVSDFLIDEQIPIHEKNKQLVVLSENKIIWVVGKRISDTYKISDITKLSFIIGYKDKMKKIS